MDRRDFNKLMGAAVAGMLVGSKAFGQEEKAEEKEAKHICKGHNDCKGQGGCEVPVKAEEEKKSTAEARSL